MNPNFTVFLQALGGKFLGPGAYNTDEIVLTLTYSGGTITLPYNLDNGPDDGNVNQVFTTGTTSPFTITTLTATDTITNYLTPDANTICGQATITPGSNCETGIIDVAIPTPNGALAFSQEVILSALIDNYRITVPIPGLYLQPGSGDTSPNQVSVFVRMMCGCKVTTGLSTSFWYPGDFSVYAEFVFNNGTGQLLPMQFDETTNDSLFYAGTAGIDMSNVTQVNFFAIQQSTGNYGYLNG